MSCQRVFLNQVIAWVALPSLTLFLAVVPAIAQTSNSDYTLLVGSGFLSDSADSSACPAVVKSADGASYELSGAGTLAPKKKLVTAAGTYTQKSSGGDVLETGVWVASELVSFDSHGVAPGALLREGRALGPPAVRPQAFANVLWLDARRRPGCAAHPPVSGVGVSEKPDAASELRPRQGA